jgi:hypothetical protein
LKLDALEKEKAFTQVNEDITKKLFDFASWIDEFIRK